jgi:hypothetical protein
MRAAVATSDCFDDMRLFELDLGLWNRTGWKINVEYHLPENEVKLKSIFDKIKDDLPSIYSPFTHDGQGNQGYLFELPDKVGKYMLRVMGLDDLAGLGISEQDAAEIINSAKSIEQDLNLTGSEREQMVKVRVGQGRFKELLIDMYGKCNLCGVDQREFLIGSHIKPWRDYTDTEKVDKNNGLLLCPHHDALFDKGFISFNEEGLIMISNELEQSSKILLNVQDDFFHKS